MKNIEDQTELESYIEILKELRKPNIKNFTFLNDLVDYKQYKHLNNILNQEENLIIYNIELYDVIKELLIKHFTKKISEL